MVALSRGASRGSCLVTPYCSLFPVDVILLLALLVKVTIPTVGPDPSEREDVADRLEFLMYAGDDVHLRLSVYGFEGFILYVAFGS